MRQIFTTVLLLLLCVAAIAQSSATNLKISILTCSNGNELYSSFGHCAFRARSVTLGFDRVYNYGTFDYHQPYFALKFVRGYLDYSVSAYPFPLFGREYVRGKREVVEQELNLSPEQTRKMFEYLEWNAREENRFYKYNFQEDNCATKIRDVIKEACGDNVIFPDSTYNFTLRQALNQNIEELPWLKLGLHIIMGLPIDQKATTYTAMYLPEHVHNTLSNTQIIIDGRKENIVKNESVVVPVKEPLDRTDIFTYISPTLVFWLIFAAWGLVTFYEVKNNRMHAWADRVFITITGFFGVVVFMLWFFTEHTVTAWNLNILWLWPTHIVAAWKTKSDSPFWNKYFKAAAITTAAMALLGPVMPQEYDIAFYPIMMILILRFIRIGFCKR